METVYSEFHADCDIKIYRDPYPESPDEFSDDSLFLISHHRDFWVQRKGWSDEDLKNKDYFFAPIEAYIHSGISLWFACEGNFPDRRWDVSQVGYIAVKRSSFGEGGKPAPDERCKEIAKSLLEEWNAYLDGRVFMYSVKHIGTGDEETCGGFYDDKWDGSSACLPDARSTAEALKRWADKEALASV